MNEEDKIYCRKAFLDLMFIPVGFLFSYISQNIISVGFNDGFFLSVHFDSEHLLSENIIAVVWLFMSLDTISAHRQRIKCLEQLDHAPLMFTDMGTAPPKVMIASAVVSIIGMFLFPLILYSESYEVFALILMILGRIWFMSTDMIYMNPVLWLFGYRFFYAETAEGKCLIVSNGSINSGDFLKWIPLSDRVIYATR